MRRGGERGRRDGIRHQMSQRRPRFDALTPIQQGLMAGVLVISALIIGSIIFLAFAIPNNWLTPQPRNRYERDLILAQDALREAESTYGTGATADGRNPYADAAAQLVLVRLEAGQSARARTDAADLYARFPANGMVGYAYARVLVADGRPATALTIIDEILAATDNLSPDLNRDLLATRARIQFSVGQRQNAYETLIEAAHIAPASADLFEEAGAIALEASRFTDAAYAYALALVFNPDSNTAREALGIIEATAPDAYAAGTHAAGSDTNGEANGMPR